MEQEATSGDRITAVAMTGLVLFFLGIIVWTWDMDYRTMPEELRVMPYHGKYVVEYRPVWYAPRFNLFEPLRSDDDPRCSEKYQAATPVAAARKVSDTAAIPNQKAAGSKKLRVIPLWFLIVVELGFVICGVCVVTVLWKDYRRKRGQ